MSKDLYRFTFCDQKRGDIIFLANYSSGCKLTVEKLDFLSSMNNLTKTERTKDPWDTFFNNATFLDLLKPIKIDLSSIFLSIADDIAKYENEYQSLEVILGEKKPNDSAFLEFVRDYPIVLNRERIRSRFIEIVETARWRIGKNSKEAKEALSDHFQPIHTGGEKCVPPNVPIKLILLLLKKLSTHLSEKIQSYLFDGLASTRKEAKANWDMYYKDILEWARKDNKRVLHCDKKTLKILTFTPAEYAVLILAKHLKLSRRALLSKLST